MNDTMQAEFNEWWDSYPRKVGKLAAMKAYEKARRMATAKELREGVGRYIQHKPNYADYAHPTTWLTQGRWMDSYEAPAKARQLSSFEEMALYHAEREQARQRVN
jgi:hypothetical protein